MTIRVAVASSDGKYVNQHFGRATQFLVFDIQEGQENIFVELRPNQPSCNWDAPSEPGHMHTIKLLADCQVVVVSMIGSTATQKLESCGLMVFQIPDFIENALKQIVNVKLG